MGNSSSISQVCLAKNDIARFAIRRVMLLIKVLAYQYFIWTQIADVPAGLKARQSKKRLRGKKPEFDEVEPESAKPFLGQLFVPPLFTTNQLLTFRTKSAVTNFKDSFGCFSLTSRFEGSWFDKSGLAQTAVQNHQRTSSFSLSESHRCGPC